MAKLYEDKDRKILPRWRSFSATLKLGELDYPLQHSRCEPPKDSGFSKRLRDWEDHSTLSFAADLLSCAISVGRTKEAQDAAVQILECDREELVLAKQLARAALGVNTSELAAVENEYPEIDPLRKGIRRLRIKLTEYPRDAVSWVDLARHYDNLGFWQQAERAILVALGLSSQNRFVLRSAARLFVHHNEYARAHQLLQDNSLLRSDPWLLAAEIALASIRKRTSKNTKLAKRIIETTKFAPLHTSELRSAIATLEAEAGNIKSCRAHLGHALVHATENSVAQAAWISRQFGPRCLEEADAQKIFLSDEASAWEFYRGSQWRKAVENALGWLADQPFSSRPAILGSYLTGVAAGDYRTSAKFAVAGLRANPNDFTLLNNAVFAFCEANDPKNAEPYAMRIRESDLSESDKTIWLATSGLLCFRQSRIEEGEKKYKEAIERAKAARDDLRLTLASLYYSQELLRHDPARGRRFFDEIKESCRNSPRPEVEALLTRTEKFANDLVI